ncbi:MAG: hypothetical protein OEU25_03690 [Rhodospirillales bacterium]|nr:hypothetical protein [Rhodospirillales bacterium]
MSFGASLDIRPDARGGGAKLGGQGAWQEALPYLLALGLGLLIHALVIGTGVTAVFDGQLYGTDGYMRLVRVTELYETGVWFDGTIERSNAPYGTELHWTRPMDLLLLAGGWALSPWLGFQKGLFWWAAAFSPLLQLAMVLTLVWAAVPLLDRWRRCLLVLAIFVQAPLISTGLLGRADHHMLISLAFVLSVGLTLRLVMRPFEARLAWAAGAALGFALWLSMEALLLLAASFAALTATWLWRAGDRARKNLWHALGLSAMVAFAIAVERPPAHYLVEEYDRISIAHLAVALLALAFWAVVRALEWRGLDARDVPRRAAVAALGAVAAGAVLYLAYPKFFGGPAVDLDPRLGPVILDLVNELKPLWPSDARSLGRFLTFLGPAVVCVPFLAVLLLRERNPANRDGWLYLAVCVASFLPLALAMLRFAPFTEVLLAIVLAELLGRLLKLSERMNLAPARVVLRAGLMLGLLTGFIALGAALSGPIKASTVRTRCHLENAYALLGQPQGLGDRPRVVLAHFNYGPELLYRTPHSVVASPYHRNVTGLIDGDRIFGARDDATSRRLIDRRGVELVLFCPDGPALVQAALKSGSTFVGRLSQGQVPAWLRPVQVPAELAGPYRLYEVVR